MKTQASLKIGASFVMILGAAGAMLIAGCSQLRGETLKGRALADYCAIEANSKKDLCTVNADIANVRGEGAHAAGLANDARSAAERAQAAADKAQGTAEAALAQSQKPGSLQCETRTLRRQSVGTCQTGYTLVSCHQSRYTYRSGGPTILRDISDTQCRFAARVLEMKLRCCSGVATAESTVPPVAPTAPARNSTTS